MGNNLRVLRKAQGWTQSEAAAAFGTALSQYAKLERGERRLSDVWIERAAQAFGIDSGDVVATRNPAPVIGTIGPGGLVSWKAGDPPPTETRGALVVSPGALGVFFDGALMTTRCRRIPAEDLVDGRPYLVLSGLWMLRRVHATGSRRTWHLSGFNVAPAFDAAVETAIACDELTL